MLLLSFKDLIEMVIGEWLAVGLVFLFVWLVVWIMGLFIKNK